MDPTLEWRTLQTPHFHVHFPTGSESLAIELGEIAERAHRKLVPWLGWEPGRPTHVVLSDESDRANGMATVFPYARMLLFPVVPDGVGELADNDDWFELLFIHEYTHVLHLDKARGLPATLRRVFGRNPLLFPNVLQPAWLKEGLATYAETDDGRGVGRGQSAYYQMLMRFEVLRGLKSLRQINLPLRSWPAGVSDYLYGVYFFRFLERRYGDDAPLKLVDAYSDNLIPFRINTNPREPFGKELEELWNAFQRALRKEIGVSLQDIHEKGIVAGTPVVEAGDFGGMIRSAGNGLLYFIHDDGYRRPWLVRWKRGERKKVVELRKGARLDLHGRAGLLITQPEICDEYNVYYDLYRYREAEGRLQRLTRCERIRWAAWSPGGRRIAAVKGTTEGVELWLLDGEGRFLSRLWHGDHDMQLSHPDWSPDGRRLALAVWQREMGWSLRLFDLQTRRWRLLLADGSVVGHPQFSPDGRYLLFVSDGGGAYNLRRIDLDRQEMETLTRVVGGAFYPVQGEEDDAIYYLNQGSEGRVIHRLEGGHTLLEEVVPVVNSSFHARPEAPVAEGPVEVDMSPYSPWATLLPRYWIPHLFLTTDTLELGITTSARDALGIHAYELDVAVESVRNALVGAFGYRYSNRFSLFTSRYNDYRLEGDGKLAAVRRRDFFQAQMTFPHTSLDSRWSLGMGVAGEQEKDVWSAAYRPRQRSTRDNLVGLLFSFDDSRWYNYAISRSDGRRVNLVLESSRGLDSDHDGVTAVGEWREYFRLGRQQVMGVRLAFGWGEGDPKPFQLGGAGGEGLDDRTVGAPRLGRRNFPLRGYPAALGELRGRRMQLGSLEWRFPLMLVERGVMAPPVGLLQWSGQLFVDSGRVWEKGGGTGNWFTGAGFELLSDVNLFYLFNLRLRFGYAYGFGEGGGDRFYLSLGNSF